MRTAQRRDRVGLLARRSIIGTAVVAGVMAVAGPAASQSGESKVVAAIDQPGEHDHYSLDGIKLGADTGVGRRITITDVGTGCDGDAPLLVSLNNPEGHWIRSFAVTRAGGLVVRAPKNPGVYGLDVHAASQDCFGLKYVIEWWGGGGAGGDIDGTAALCRVRHARVATAQRAVRRLRNKLRTVSAAARPRYRAYLETAKRQLDKATRDAHKACDS